jgi:Uma2 family endonuclease
MATDFRMSAVEVPTLRDGDRLTRDEFERRWDAMPEVKKAELIEGVVRIPAAPSIGHCEAHFDIIGWLGLYRLVTPCVEGADNTSIRFNDRNMPQPDVLLRILDTHGGRCRVTDDRYLEGGPELIAEISKSTTDIDLGVKRDVYRRFGVQEYIVWRVTDRALDWFALRSGAYQPLEAGSDGVICSAVFPGLWLDPAALVNGDSARLLAVAQLGHGSPEHGAFIAELRDRAAPL